MWNILHGVSFMVERFVECERRTIGGNQNSVVACMCRRCACIGLCWRPRVLEFRGCWRTPVTSQLTGLAVLFTVGSC